ncbi:NAD-dependent succinate-semialdehyde dehydrogenase [Ensifer adhaerens]|uniref:NAD-dependent succinate-semialdehyde dehydrogenase n=1 Tax=Ensifer adhaerens TaxID=106592 RepID=A0A9Q8YGE0_ENSAD|nr:NAD-dependent succinate-semialdehyde dehydrogenase [Ensifer adhaerens]USJ28427.1 NAD-dependent succinate-semialdehyde dehydrogenase [Ensifer adhaerens]
MHTPEELERRIAATQTAQKAWASFTIHHRSGILRQAAALLRRDVQSLAAIATREMGKTLVQAEAEVSKCATCLEFYADNAPSFLAADQVATEAAESFVIYEPVGTVLAIMPWNYPFWQVIRFAAPALAAGNAILLKHADNVPQCALELEALLVSAGLPEGLVANIFIEPDQVERVLSDDRVGAVTFTGSTRAGSAVAQIAGRAIKKSVLELGGSDPFIILADADLEAAVSAAVKARFQNNGQSCIASKRFLVEAAIADEFVDRFAQATAELRVGNPMDRTTDVGPMAKEAIRRELDALVRASVADGAVVRAGGGELSSDGLYFHPTVLDHVTRHMPVATEETFGPVAAVMRVADLGEAIALANSSPYGLGATVWTTSQASARTAAAQLQAGAVVVNGVVASDPRLPFGGVKRSGYGRELSVHGLREFTVAKSVSIVTQPSN